MESRRDEHLIARLALPFCAAAVAEHAQGVASWKAFIIIGGAAEEQNP
jgi:hypothetical protein